VNAHNGGMTPDHNASYRAIMARDARFDGQLFTGVKTTRVYCRPICPARTPRQENVVFFPTATAAQAAGFRPCLRCRPETSPDLAAWRGTSNTVSRAMALIETGALDAADVAGLADRLGMGERHLRRLFRQHLGASPVAVAQTRRVLLAKQLLHETRLPMAEVALAAGFGSIRRFNETFQSLYRRPPSALRRDAPEISAQEGSTLSLRLSYRPPYDWDAMIRFLRLRAIPGVERVEPGRYARSIAMGQDKGIILVHPLPANQLAVDVTFPRLGALPAIIARVRQLFDLAADPRAIAAQLGLDPVLAPLVVARPGLRVPGAWDGFELAVRAILGQQISVAGATALVGKIAAAYGEPLPAKTRYQVEGLTHVFPHPSALAGADLAGLGMPRARAASLSSLAAAVLADPLVLGPRRSLDAAVDHLKTLPGIGEWTAQYIAMRGLREPDAFPHGDVGLLRALADAEGRRPSAAALLTRAQAWRPWRAYAALHLWTGGGAQMTEETANER
jgi:AraC family transcriptional regulator, regulatory protein of adaptative response / DNA-3-methyladenine glycosylase II